MGLIWEKAHKPVLERLGESIQLKAFCTSSLDSMKRCKALYPALSPFDSYQALVGSRDLDAVLVLTPIQLNAAVTIAALNAGKDVFVEKPMALNVRDGQRIIEEERRTGKRVYILEQVLYSRKWEIVEQAIESGKIGSVVMFDYLDHFFLDHTDDKTGGYGKTQWRIEADFPLGALFDGGIHDIAIMTKLFKKPAYVLALGSNLRKEFGKYDHIALILQYSNACTGFFSHSAFLGGSENYFHIRGTEGLISLREAHVVTEKKNGEKWVTEVEEENLHEIMWRRLIRCIEKNEKPPFSSSDALEGLMIMEGIERSLAHGGIEPI